MWRITKVRIKNFRSFHEEEHEFLQDKTTLIFGLHRKAAFSNSNGTGKSSFMKSIEFALLGIVSRTLPKEEYVHNGEKECSVTLWMSNAATKTDLIIKRSLFRSKSKPGRVSVFVNGVENKQLINEVEANKFIEHMLQIAKEDLLNYFIVGQSTQMSFLRTTDARQKEIIANFANINLLDPVLNEVKGFLEQYESDINLLRSSQRKAEGKAELLQEQIEQFLEEMEVSDDTEAELEFAKFKHDQEIRLKNAREKLAEEQRELAELRELATSAQEVVKGHSKELSSDLEAKSVERRMIKKKLDHYQQQLEGAIRCPACGHDFLLDGEVKFDELPDLIKSFQDDVERLGREHAEIESKIDSQQQESRKLRTIRSGVESKQSDIEEVESIIVRILRGIEAKQAEFDKVHLEKVNPNEGIVLRLANDLEAQLAEIESIKTKINTLQVESEKYRFWQNNFGLKGFKTFLINRVLELIQANINFYLSKVSTFQIKMEGYKILSSGELREKITILVSKDGINWDFYEKFSGGQKTRIDICAVFALRRIINQNAAEKGGGLNFLGLDEAFDGLDASGQKHIIDTLDGIGETCLVISHSNDNVAFKNKITIGYDDSGVSKIL